MARVTTGSVRPTTRGGGAGRYGGRVHSGQSSPRRSYAARTIVAARVACFGRSP